MNISSKRRLWVGLATAMVVGALIVQPASAKSWSASGNGWDWFDDDNWSPVGVPGAEAAVTVASGASILLTNETAALASFTMTGGAMTFSNWFTRVHAVEVELQDGTLTLPPAFSENQMSNRIWIVCSNLTVGSEVTLQAESRGYRASNGPGISTAGRGASHGGYGATGANIWGARRQPYGSIEEPTDPGSGGHSPYTTASGAGGGAIRIDAAGEVAVHGILTANGGHQGATHASGGSGGSIYITCRTFAGSGTGHLSAHGGNGNTGGGAGAGGRIAVVYDPAAQAAVWPVNPGVRIGAIRGVGGYAPNTAEDGTIYLPDTLWLSAQMTTQWLGGNIHIPGFTQWSVDSLEIAGKFNLPGVTNLFVTNNLSIASGGLLWLYSQPTNDLSGPDGFTLTIGGHLTVDGTLRLHSDPTNGASPRIGCNQLTLNSGGVIDADFLGYGYQGFGGYSAPGAGTGERGGGGHGGRGSSGSSAFGNQGAAYGDPLMPTEPGSGGGHTSLSGFGGGAIRLYVTNAATIHGTLTANGMGALSTHGAGGSGGSILIVCTTFHGSPTGLLRADGGSAQNAGGAGAGGRIAVRYDPVEQAALTTPNPGVRFGAAPSASGTHSFLAEPGTVYLPNAETLFLSSDMSQWADVSLHIPGLTHWEVPSSLNVGGGRFGIPSLKTMRVQGDLTIAAGGRLFLYGQPTNVTGSEIGFQLEVMGSMTVAGALVMISDPETGGTPYIECANFDLQTGATIDADFRGFHIGRGDGQGIDRAGGGYGGAGSRGNDVAANAGPTYARAHAPIYPGSGAGLYGNGGGRGGGAVRIGAHNAMTIDGTISAHGMARSVIHAGGGSGGGILLSAKTFTGSGTLRANGGNSSNGGGAGGGGRIAVWMPFIRSPSLSQWVHRDLPALVDILDHEVLWPDLTLSVARGIGGTNPEEAKDGTIFFGRLIMGSMISFR